MNNKFDIKNIQFTDIHFNQIKNIDVVENINVSIGSVSGYFKDIDNTILQLDLQIDIELSDKSKICDFSTKVSALFLYNDDFSEDELRTLLPILYLHSKPLILQIASVSNIPLFSLPALDFNEIKMIDFNNNKN